MPKTKSSKVKEKERRKNSGAKENSTEIRTFEVEKVIDRRIGDKGEIEYLTLWKGYKRLSWWSIENFIIDGELLPCVSILDEILDGQRTKPQWRINYETKRDSGGNVMLRDKPHRKKEEVTGERRTRSTRASERLDKESEKAAEVVTPKAVDDKTKRDEDRHEGEEATAPVPTPAALASADGSETPRRQTRGNGTTAGDTRDQATVPTVPASLPLPPSTPRTEKKQVFPSHTPSSSSNASNQTRISTRKVIICPPSASNTTGRSPAAVPQSQPKQNTIATALAHTLGASTMSFRSKDTLPVAKSAALSVALTRRLRSELQIPGASGSNALSKPGPHVSPSQQLLNIGKDTDNKKSVDQRVANGSTTKNIIHSGMSLRNMGGATSSRTLDELSGHNDILGTRGATNPPQQQIRWVPKQRSNIVDGSPTVYQLIPVRPDAIPPVGPGQTDQLHPPPRNPSLPSQSGNGSVSSGKKVITKRYYKHRKSLNLGAAAPQPSEDGYINARKELKLENGRSAEKRQVPSVEDAITDIGAAMMPRVAIINKRKSETSARVRPFTKNEFMHSRNYNDDDIEEILQELRFPFTVPEIAKMDRPEFRALLDKNNYTLEQMNVLRSVRTKISNRYSRRKFRDKVRKTFNAQRLANNSESAERGVVSLLDATSGDPPMDSSSLHNSASSSSGADDERDVLNDPPCSSAQSDPSRSAHSTQMDAVLSEMPSPQELAPSKCFWKRPSEFKGNKFEGMEGKILGIPDYDIQPNPDTATLGTILEVRRKMVKVRGFDADESCCEFFFAYDACLSNHWKSHPKAKPLWKAPLRRKSDRNFRELIAEVLQQTADNESANVVPPSCFDDQMTWDDCPSMNYFKVNHCLETYSRKSGRFSSAIVVAVTKETVTIHLDGAPKEHTVELPFDDVRLFPRGFAQSIGEECKAPENIEEEWPVENENEEDEEEEEEEDESDEEESSNGLGIYEVERCYARRWNKELNEYEYWTKWLNYPHTENTWETCSNLSLTCATYCEDIDKILDNPSSYKYKWYKDWKEAVALGKLPKPAAGGYRTASVKTGRGASGRKKSEEVKKQADSGDQAKDDSTEDQPEEEMTPEKKAQIGLELGILPPHDPSKPFFDWVQHGRSKLYGGRIAPAKAFWKRQLGPFDNQFAGCEGLLLRAPDFNAPYEEMSTLSVVCNVASVLGPWVEVNIFGNEHSSYCRWYLAKDPCLHPFNSLSDDSMPKLKKSSNQGIRNDRLWRDAVEEYLKSGMIVNSDVLSQQISWKNEPSENFFEVGDKLEVYDEIMGDGHFNPATVINVHRRGTITINFDGSSKSKDVHYKDLRLFPAGFAAAIGWTCQLYQNDNPFKRKSKDVTRVPVHKSVSPSDQPSPSNKRIGQETPRKTLKRKEAKEEIMSPLSRHRRNRAPLPTGMKPRQMDDDEEERGMAKKMRRDDDKRREQSSIERPDDESAMVDLSHQCSSRGLLPNNDEIDVDTMSEDGIEENPPIEQPSNDGQKEAQRVEQEIGVADEAQIGEEEMLPIEQSAGDANAVDGVMEDVPCDGPALNYTGNDVRLLVNQNCTMGQYIDTAKFRAAFIDPEDYTLSTAWELIFKKLVKHTTDLPQLLEALPECAREDSSRSIRVNAGGQSYCILVPVTIDDACTCLKQILNKLHACINAISLTGKECTSCTQEERVEL